MAEANLAADCATVIGADAEIKGEIKVEKGIRVDGKIEGSVETEGKVFVGKSGQFKADITAGTVVIEGKVEGNITASDRVQVEAGAEVHGDLSAKKLVINDGATFSGNVTVGAKGGSKSESSASVNRLNTLSAVGAGNGNGSGGVLVKN